MPGSLDVYLNDRRIGSMTNLPGDYNLFTFDEEYLEDPSPPILTQAYLDDGGQPETVIPRIHRVAPAFFANLLPEDTTVLRQLVARQYGIHPTRDFPYMRVLGRDLPGAVIMRGIEDTDADDEIGTPVLAQNEQRLKFSLAGMQLKFSASTLNQRLSIDAEDGRGSWIVKLPTNAYPRLPENEFSVMTLATAIGLNVPDIRLVPLDEIEGIPSGLPVLRKEEARLAYAIKRFDREPERRVHCEDFNQIANQKPDEKDANYSSSWIAHTIHALCPPEDAEDFVRRLVFGVCTGNNDMHLKNWGLIYPDGRTPRISPMYDYVSTRYYWPTAELILTIGGERKFERIDRGALRAFAKIAELSERRTIVLADEIVEKVRAVWPEVSAGFTDRSFVAAMQEHFETVPLMCGK